MDLDAEEGGSGQVPVSDRGPRRGERPDRAGGNRADRDGRRHRRGPAAVGADDRRQPDARLRLPGPRSGALPAGRKPKDLACWLVPAGGRRRERSPRRLRRLDGETFCTHFTETARQGDYAKRPAHSCMPTTKGTSSLTSNAIAARSTAASRPKSCRSFWTKRRVWARRTRPLKP